MASLQEAIALLQTYKSEHPGANKAALQEAFIKFCNPRKERSVFVAVGFAMRFCEANTTSFSNAVLSLSAVQKYDRDPLVICIVRPGGLDFRLVNTTFLKKISHSSHHLSFDNIKGSFLGHDIVDEYEGIANRPENFEALLITHNEFEWKDNVTRLVEATRGIVGRSMRYEVTEEAREQLLKAPTRAEVALQTIDYRDVALRLSTQIEKARAALLAAAALDNVNIRGNTIEQIVTGDVNEHRLDDLAFALSNGMQLMIDVKTKLLDRASAPKAYNIDKTLAFLAKPGSVSCFLFIGIDVEKNIVQTRLVSIFDPIIVKATRIQVLWAGRSSRGVTQLSGDLSNLFTANYHPGVDVKGGQALLELFLKR
jgi:hypothetical protein